MRNAITLLYLFVMVHSYVVGENHYIWVFPTVSYIQGIEDYNKSFDFTSKRIYKYYSLEPGEKDYPFIVADDNYIYLRDSTPKFRIEKASIMTENDGFQTFREGSIRWIVITGSNYFATNRVKYKSSDVLNAINRFTEIRNDLLTKSMDLKDILIDFVFIMPQVIKSVCMSAPFLEETIGGIQYRYDDDMLLYRWFYMYLNRGLVGMYFINDSTPMVEGGPGNGEGLTIDIEYHIPSDNLVVLNGFVDLNRRHLYKRNARMKKVLVQGAGFEFEYEFKDYVHFAQIDFPKQVDRIRLTVQEVYDGSHYEDLCISGLFTNPDVLHTRNSTLAYELLEDAKKEWQQNR